MPMRCCLLAVASFVILATSALAENTTELSNLMVQVGDSSRLLARFPSLGGTDTSGRSVIRDLNTIAGAALRA